MNVQNIILNLRYDGNVKNIAQTFLSDDEALPELVHLVVSEKTYPIPDYGSWILFHVCKKDPNALLPFREQLIDCILLNENQTTLRNLVNILQQLELSDYRSSELLDRLLSFITNNENKVALFVYSLYKLIQFVKVYPELISEIESIIELKPLPHQPAMRVAIRNFRKATSGLQK